MKCLVLFDFDGTLTKRDSFISFLRTTNSSLKFFFGLIVLSPVLALYKLHILPNWKAKQLVVYFFYKGVSEDFFSHTCKNFSQKNIPLTLKNNALKKLNEHLLQKHQVVIVSASLEYYLSDWCKSVGADLIATRLEIIDGKITGNFSGKNCYGKEKAIRIREKYSLDSFDKIVAYGDSIGDKEMLELADEKHYRTF
ncbi:MAG: HAD-IB family hydrolase [Bacteroidia bacterium]|nr:HAD-IB family hydrolase [Bacteroidia bacterium]